MSPLFNPFALIVIIVIVGVIVAVTIAIIRSQRKAPITTPSVDNRWPAEDHSRHDYE